MLSFSVPTYDQARAKSPVYFEYLAPLRKRYFYLPNKLTQSSKYRFYPKIRAMLTNPLSPLLAIFAMRKDRITYVVRMCNASLFFCSHKFSAGG